MPSTDTPSPPDTVYVHALALEQLHESPWNPRKTWDAAKLAELTESIREVGVLTPLLVRPNEDGYEIAAGHRRYRAALAAGLTHVPVQIRPLDDRALREILIIENLQRDDIAPLDEAAGFQALRQAAPDTRIEDLATRVGRSPSYVYQRLKLLDLIDRAQTWLADGDLTLAHAHQLARLTPAQQTVALDWFGAGDIANVDNISARELASWIQHEFFLRLKEAPFRLDDGTLVQSAGPCTSCPKRTGASPQLFADVAAEDTCTDRACFYLKVDAYVEVRRRELAMKHPTLVEVSTRYSFYSKDEKPLQARGVRPASAWEEVKKKDEGAVPAVVVDAPYEPKVLGSLKWVRLATPRDEASARSGGGDTWQAQQKRQQEKAKFEKAVKVAALRQIAAAIHPILMDEPQWTSLTARVLLPALLDISIGSGTQQALWTELTDGLTPPDPTKRFKRATLYGEDLSFDQLGRALIVAALWPCVFSYGDPTIWQAALKAFGIDEKALARDVKASAKGKGRGKRTAAQKGTRAARKVSPVEDLEATDDVDDWDEE